MQALARCVGDVDEFLQDRFGRAPHLWRAGAGAHDDLLTLADVDAQLAGGGLRRPAVRVVRDGELVDPATWTRRARTGAVRVDDLVHPGRVLSLFGEGATIALQSLHRWWDPLTRFCRTLEAELGHAVQANAYLTPPSATGFTPHHDTHDVFVLQLHGTKRWTVRAPLVVDPLPRHRSDHEAAAGQPVTLEVELHPGDCLYLPRGHIHSAATAQGASLHLTVGVLVTTVHDVLRRLVDLAADEPELRRTVRRAGSLTGGAAAGDPAADPRLADAAQLKGIVAELTAWLERLDGDDADLARSLAPVLGGPPRRAPLLHGVLVDLAELDALDDATVLARRDGVGAPEVQGPVVELDLGDRRLELPGHLAPALELLLDGAPRPVGELDGLLDRASRAVLCRRLVREGVLGVVRGA